MRLWRLISLKIQHQMTAHTHPLHIYQAILTRKKQRINISAAEFVLNDIICLHNLDKYKIIFAQFSTVPL